MQKLNRNDSHGREELSNTHIQNIFKVGALLFVGIAALGLWVIEFISPNFFNYPYWVAVDASNVLKFYPLFLVGLGWAVLFGFKESSSSHDGKILAAETFGYVLTGIWEELGFRWAFIPYSMIILACTNWFWSVGLGYGIGAVALVGGAMLIYQGKSMGEKLLGIALLPVAGFLFWVGISIDPVYWVFQKILLPLANFTTFGQMKSILLGSTTPLFLYGIFAVNSWFRDGHKYQGPLGWINSWYAGMVLIYATMTYGITTAIVIHALYDIIFAVTKYVMRKVSAVFQRT